MKSAHLEIPKSKKYYTVCLSTLKTFSLLFSALLLCVISISLTTLTANCAESRTSELSSKISNVCSELCFESIESDLTNNGIVRTGIEIEEIEIIPVVESSGLSIPESAKVSVEYTKEELILSWPEIRGATNYILAIGIEPDEYVLELELGKITYFRYFLQYLGDTTLYAMVYATDGKDKEAIGYPFHVLSPNAFTNPPQLTIECDTQTLWLRWNSVNEADSFIFEIGSVSGNYTLSHKFNVTDFTQYPQPVINAPLSVLPDGNLYFAVKAQKGNTVGPRSNEISFGRYKAGNTITLNDGTKFFSPATASNNQTDIFFYPVQKPANIGDNVIASYAFFSTEELSNTELTIPIKGIVSPDDIDVMHVQGATGPVEPLEFAFDAAKHSVTVQLKNNWTFSNIPSPLKGESEDIADDIQYNSDNKILVLLKESDGGNQVFNTNTDNIIEMPYFEQSDGTCWAAAAMMLRKGSYPAEDGPLSDRMIYQWMSNMGIGINDGLGFLSYHLYTELIGDDEVTYSRFFSYESVKKKIIELIDQGLPVIFARSGHIVLVLGYRYNDSGDFILIQHNSDSENNMYEEIPFLDSFKENAFTQLVMLTWSKIPPHFERVKQSIGIPSYSSSPFGSLYFSGKDTQGKSGKIYLKFDETADKGYTWHKLGNVGDDFLQDHATTLNYEIPIYNGDRNNSAEVTLWIELAESELNDSGKNNSIYISKNVIVSPTDTTTVSGTIDISPIKNNLESEQEFTLYVSLLDTKTMASTTEVTLEKITFGPAVEEVQPPNEAIISDFNNAYSEYNDRWGIGPMTAGFASGWFVSKDVADYNSSGGNPAGCLSWVGDQRDWWFFTTYSSRYKGDRSFAFSKRLTFDLKTDNTKAGTSFFIPFIVISGTDTTGKEMHIFQPQSNYTEPTGNAWTSYSVMLKSGYGWMASKSGSLTAYVDATDEDIQQVLSTLTSLRIRGEYGSSRQTGALDNVKLGVY